MKKSFVFKQKLTTIERTKQTAFYRKQTDELIEKSSSDVFKRTEKDWNAHKKTRTFLKKQLNL